MSHTSSQYTKPISASASNFTTRNRQEITSSILILHSVIAVMEDGGNGESLGVVVDLNPVKVWMERVLLKPRSELTVQDVEDLIDAVHARITSNYKNGSLSSGFSGGSKRIMLPSSLAMTKLVVTLTGRFEGTGRSEMERMILDMNGTVNTHLTSTTTHIVSTNSMSEKTLAARAWATMLKEENCTDLCPIIPIVLPSWVEHAYQMSFSNPYFYAATSVDNHLQQIFYNVTYAISSSVGEFSTHVRNAFNSHGGTEVPLSSKPKICVCRTTDEVEYDQAIRYSSWTATPAWCVISAFDNKLNDINYYKVKDPSPDHFRKMEEDETDLRLKLEQSECGSPFVAGGSKHSPSSSVETASSPPRPTMPIPHCRLHHDH